MIQKDAQTRMYPSSGERARDRSRKHALGAPTFKFPSEGLSDSIEAQCAGYSVAIREYFPHSETLASKDTRKITESTIEMKRKGICDEEFSAAFAFQGFH